MRRILTLLLPLAAGAALTGCADYYGRGYGGVAVGVGYGGYGGVYDDFGYYAANPYWGWYNGFYYPGSGIYVYDRYRRPHSWEPYRNYWSQRRGYWQGNPQWRQSRRQFRDNWNDFRANGGQAGRPNRQFYRPDGAPRVRGDGQRGPRWQGERGNRGNGQRGRWGGRRGCD